jgi:hypothetical protein
VQPPLRVSECLIEFIFFFVVEEVDYFTVHLAVDGLERPSFVLLLLRALEYFVEPPDCW